VEITIIDHLGINITDLNRSAEWYMRVFGFEIIHKWTTTWMIGKGQIRIGLFQRPNATPVEDLDNTIAITHLAFLTDTDGFGKAQDELKKLGVPFDPPEIRVSRTQYFCKILTVINSKSQLTTPLLRPKTILPTQTDHVMPEIETWPSHMKPSPKELIRSNILV
jgi:extradiol dioxygenase family protein